MMQELAKAGFNQSYTYFTWRNSKAELAEYFAELIGPELKEFFRANFFTNTPDILPEFLQKGARPAFLIRSVLAAMACPVYGIYSGFELCENAALPGREEYADSEKYQFKGRDWNAPGNIKEFLTRLNTIRRQNRALQEYANLRIQGAENDNILAFSKTTVGLDNLILVVVTLDPWQPQTAFVQVPLADFGIGADEPYVAEDLLTGEQFAWRGSRNFVALHPSNRPAHVFRIRRWQDRIDGRDVFA
jgi:starch synthase (maltosyl-transferring)